MGRLILFVRGLHPALDGAVARLSGSPFAKSVSTLVGGTVLGQAVPILLTPILTRIYSPEEFGLLGLFVSVFGMISVIACLQYDTAIPLPPRDESAANLLALAVIFSAITATATAAAVGILGASVGGAVGLKRLGSVGWFLPIVVFVAGTLNALQYWAVRQKAFARIAKSRFAQALAGTGTQLALGLGGAGAPGLIAGHVLSYCAGCVVFLKGSASDWQAHLRGVSVSGMRAVARTFRRFPLFTALEALSNTAAIQLPLLLIAQFATAADVGFLLLGMRVMQAPMGVLGVAIAQVYYADAVIAQREGTLAELTVRVVKQLARIGVGPLLFVGITAPAVCAPVFGSGWGRAGVLIGWMTPWFVFQFLSSPVSMVLYVTKNQLAALGLQVFGLVFRVGAVLACGNVFRSEAVAETYAISGFAFYVLYFVVVCRVSGITWPRLVQIGFAAARPIGFWVSAGVGIVLVFGS